MGTIENSRQVSLLRFKSIEHIVKKMLNAEHLMNIEEEQAIALKMLDYKAGIDAIAIINNSAYGVALRMCRGSYNSFTIRALRRSTNILTEMEKRYKEISDNSLKPAYTVQAYFDVSGKINIAVCKTADLIDYIYNNRGRYTTRTSNDGENIVDYHIVAWSDFRNTGKFIRTTQAMLTSTNAERLNAV